MTVQTLGTQVRIGGTHYKIVDISWGDACGSKFAGKAIFTLIDSTGARFTAYGVRVAWNSKLTPVVADVPVDVPAPPSCDHEAGSDGCALDSCKGVPAASLADRNRSDIRPDASPSECGADSYGRDIANACQARMRNASVTMPVYTDSDHWTRKGMRSVSAYAFTVGGHAVTVVTYEVPGNCLSLDAIWVDGFRVIADYDSIRNGRVNALAYLITEHIAMITVRADADPSLASAVPAGASIVARHLSELRPGDVVRSFYDYRGHATVTGLPVRRQYSHTVATVADGQASAMTGAPDAVYAVIVPAEISQDATETPAGSSESTGTPPRGEVTVWGPSDAPHHAGHGTSRRWTRTLAGVPYGFTAVLMPSGERRYFVNRYNGYGDNGTAEGRASGMRFGCAWSPVHSITVAAPDATPAGTAEVTPDATGRELSVYVPSAECGCPRATLALIAPHTPTDMPSIGHRATCGLHTEPKGPTMIDTATPASEVTPDATPAPIPARQYGHLAATVSVVDLLPALILAAWGAPKYASVPVLAGVLLTGDGDTLTVASFDWERSTRTVVPVAGDASGRSLVYAKDLLTLVKGFKPVKAGRGKTLPVGANMVTLADNGRELTVTYGSRVSTLPNLPAEDFPALPDVPATVATVDAATFAASVKRVTPAASRDDTLPSLTMVHCAPNKAGTAVVMTTTDRYRAVFESCPWSQVADSVSLAPWAHAHMYAPTLAYVASLAGKVGGPVVIGYATCTGLATKEKITITESVGWSFGPHTITTATPDVGFPTVRAIWPDTFAGVITVNAATLGTAVKALNASGDKTCPIVIKAAGESLALSISTGSDGGRDTDTVAATSITLPDGFTLATNGKFLMDAITPAGTADVVLSVVSANKAFTVTVPAVPTYECMVMTVRIGGNESNDDHKATTAAATSEESTVNTHTPAAPAVPVAAVPVPVPATPATPDKIDAVERDADAARVAMLAGDFPAAFKLLRKAERIAPAGYLVGKGNMTFDAIRAMITSAVDARNADMDCEKDLRPVASVPAPVATVVPVVPLAPVAPVDVPAPVTVPDATPDATPASDDFDPRTVLSGATWGHANIGTARAPHTVDVLTLPAGRLAREQYTAVSAIVRSIGGAWNRKAGGFAFEPSHPMFGGGYSASGSASLAAYLTGEPTGQPAESSAPVASVPDATPAPAPVASVPVVDVSAPVAVPDGVDLADARLTPALTVADASALSVAKSAAVAAIVTPASVPVVLVDASDALTFLLAPFATSGASYMASRKVVRRAMLAAGIRGNVAACDSNRRAFTVVCDLSDRERVSVLVAGAVVLDTVTV